MTRKIGFAQIFKVDEAKHEVWGILTEETPDSMNEIFDYDSSKPYFEAWSERTKKVTNGLSLGALREMHQLIAVGKLIAMNCDDVLKRISIGAKVVDDDAWIKVTEGVLTGFSIGGRFVDTWKDKKNKRLTRFTADPIEASLVDVPCLPTAVFESIKADGTVETKSFKNTEVPMASGALDALVSRIDSITDDLQALKAEKKTKRVAGEDLTASAFAYVGDPSDTSTWKLPISFSSEEKTKRHIRSALARFNQTKGIPESEKPKVHARIVAAAKKHGIDVAEEDSKAAEFSALVEEAITKALTETGFTKSLQNISDLTSILTQLRWVLMDAMWEAEFEGGTGDDRDAAIAVEVEAAMQHLIEILKDVVEEETSELLATKKAAALAEERTINMKDWVEIQKKAAHLAAHFRKAAAHHAAMAEHHKAAHEEHTGLHESHAAMCKACKAEGDGDGKDDLSALHKALHAHHKVAMGHHKALAAHHLKMHKAHAAHAEHHSKMADGYDGEEKAARLEVEKAGGKIETTPFTVEDIRKAFSDSVSELVKSLAPAPAATEPATSTTPAPAPDLAKALADLQTAISGLPKMVEDAVKKHDESRPAPNPTGFSLVPRTITGKAAGTTTDPKTDTNGKVPAEIHLSEDATGF